MAVIGREAARAPLTSADINDGIVTAADLAPTLDLSSKSVTLPTLATVDINGGNIDGTIIGAATPAAGSFTTGQFGTSLNVDGTVTADGLTVDANSTTGAVKIQSGDNNTFGAGRAQLALSYNATDDYQHFVRTSHDVVSSGNKVELLICDGTQNNTITSGSNRVISLAGNGDISFYEDTGTTPKFFWDASAEALGIGTTSPSSYSSGIVSYNTPITVVGNQYDGNLFDSMFFGGVSENLTYRNIIRNSLSATPANQKMQFSVANGASTHADVMTLSGDGNVGIGTSSPGVALDVHGNIFANSADSTNNAEKNGIYFGGTTGGSSTAGANSAIVGFRGSSFADGELIFKTLGSSTLEERMRIDSAGLVGIGTTGPQYLLHVLGSNSGGDMGATIQNQSNSTNGSATLRLSTSTISTRGAFIRGLATSGSGQPTDLIFGTGGAYQNADERARIDSSGNLLVGTTAASNTVESIALTNNGQISSVITTAGGAGQNLFLNRQDADGDFVLFRKANSTVGSIGSYGSRLFIASASNNGGLRFDVSGSNLVLPCNSNGTNSDNDTDLGYSSARFDDIYATNGTIQTSDANEKQDIEELSEAERRAAVAAKGLLRKFRWISSVEEKGDEARIHFGIIAQDLQAAFEAEGLDAGRYAMFIHSTWTDEETGEERSRMGVRYSELLAFIIAAL